IIDPAQYRSTLIPYTTLFRSIRVEQMWQQHFIAVNKANAALQKIPDMEINQELKDRLLGEALFLRALFYFNLVRLYGDVPLLLRSEEHTSELQSRENLVCRLL